jgi:hypothetical protein
MIQPDTTRISVHSAQSQSIVSQEIKLRHEPLPSDEFTMILVVEESAEKLILRAGFFCFITLLLFLVA